MIKKYNEHLQQELKDTIFLLLQNNNELSDEIILKLMQQYNIPRVEFDAIYKKK